ncbi:cupin domain-containing protein [Stutzerimonas azotifigens]|uniref:Cupin domain-containing protein n=1 Tax=Stutzerimonas azotifigens TaxID=291995 RepID=A0ABR5YYX8_9GAMM|nr:cupin domain-containing protein [Stutzerimonas azotifigens]MBA1273129.1 cupin domain-containing protein [Stutzerimonas azotifigens]
MPSSAQTPEQLQLHSDGRTPNSPHPVLIYRDLPLADGDYASAFEALFATHLWPAQWRADVYDYHHYHSTAHEVLGVASGNARLMLGGEQGQEVEVRRGDVLVLPAGTGHCQLSASEDFLVVGGYPVNQPYDVMRPDAATHDEAVARIARVDVPISDPVAGTQGALVSVWRQA